MEKETLYIQLNEYLTFEQNNNLVIKTSRIRKILDDLKIDEEYEVVMTGNYEDWGNFINMIISKVNQKDLT